jgi:hypothetical protein
VAFPNHRVVGAKNAPQQPAALGKRNCQVFSEGRGTTTDRFLLAMHTIVMPLLHRVIRSLRQRGAILIQESRPQVMFDGIHFQV